MVAAEPRVLSESRVPCLQMPLNEIQVERCASLVEANAEPTMTQSSWRVARNDAGNGKGTLAHPAPALDKANALMACIDR